VLLGGFWGRSPTPPYKVHPEGEKGMESLGIDRAIPMPKHMRLPCPPRPAEEDPPLRFSNHAAHM
jgi:hypothetical protein